MSHTEKLLALLAEGHFCSGEVLGERLGISRSAVWKQIKALKTQGVDCYAVPGKGYKLAQPLELFCSQRIRGVMDQEASALLPVLEIFSDVASTNRYLMERLSTGLACGHVCLAERQTAGRGRRGRQWVSPFGRNIYLSIYWSFQLSPVELSGLALSVGVAIAKVLRRLGLSDVQLKWPNDVLWQGKKLAGILLETMGEAAGPHHVVVGVGLNIDMCPRSAVAIEQAWIDLMSALGKAVSRNTVAGLLLAELLFTFQRYQQAGFASFVDEWQALDAYRGQRVFLDMPSGRVDGRVVGVDRSGALRLDTAEGLRCYHSGEVSLRPIE